MHYLLGLKGFCPGLWVEDFYKQGLKITHFDEKLSGI